MEAGKRPWQGPKGDGPAMKRGGGTGGGSGSGAIDDDVVEASPGILPKQAAHTLQDVETRLPSLQVQNIPLFKSSPLT